MAEIKSFQDYMDDLEKDEDTDMNNPSCIACNECCTATATITMEEYKTLQEYFTTDKQGRKLFNIGKNKIKKHLRKGVIYMMCPLTNDENKKCSIYDMRPEICKLYHCSKELKGDYDKRKKEIESNPHKMILELFIDI